MSDLKNLKDTADTIIDEFEKLCALKGHPKLEFIGEQESAGGDPIYVYNCQYCGTAVSGDPPEDYECT